MFKWRYVSSYDQLSVFLVYQHTVTRVAGSNKINDDDDHTMTVTMTMTMTMMVMMAPGGDKNRHLWGYDSHHRF